ncbi:MAG: DUF3604 domain-containing protein [Alphaproteobacteria bacterium]
MRKLLTFTALAGGLAGAMAVGFAGTAQASEQTQLYWGDTHLHTRYSFDAFLNGNLSADPDTAYRFAKGQPVIHPYHRAWMQIDQPLDFLVVSDHAELMGVLPAIYEGQDLPSGGIVKNVQRWLFRQMIRSSIDEDKGGESFREITHELPVGEPRAMAELGIPESPLDGLESVEVTAWNDIVETADRHNVPGKFTAFIGWEWTSTPGGANQHRVVMSTANAEQAKTFAPFGSDQSMYPDDLWNFLKDQTAKTGANFMSIPHNSNVSMGYMFDDKTLRGENMSPDYLALRTEFETVAEVTQIKGDSETNPAFSPNDEFAAFEPYSRYLNHAMQEYKPARAEFLRPTLRRGLKLSEELGTNPFKLGLIGASDSHTGLSAIAEDKFSGKMALDSIPANKDGDQGIGVTGWGMSASGYAGVWAAENTREALFAAFKRREVYATTGPRIMLRVFGGHNFDMDDAVAEDMADIGYAKGVPMGGDLTAADSTNAPQLLIRAVKDPRDANLDRVQVIKGWLDSNGDTHEHVYDVAWSDNRTRNADGTVPPVGNTVDVETARYTNTIGAAELATVWTDPDFDPAQKAFYYVRVIQIPTPRHSLFDTIALKQKHIDVDAGPASIQERAYSSPIWYTP